MAEDYAIVYSNVVDGPPSRKINSVAQCSGCSGIEVIVFSEGERIKHMVDKEPEPFVLFVFACDLETTIFVSLHVPLREDFSCFHLASLPLLFLRISVVLLREVAHEELKEGRCIES